MATINSVVATGLRMKMRDGLTGVLWPPLAAAGPAGRSLTRVRLGRPGLVRRTRRAGLIRVSSGAFELRVHLRVFLQFVDAGHYRDVARFEPEVTSVWMPSLTPVPICCTVTLESGFTSQT